ncbi:MAG: DegT/DnrJ/EryC1/StrS family aminotransferase [Bacteroidaceae bacterium]
MNHSQPNITEQEALAVYHAVLNGDLANGKIVEQFEFEFTKQLGYKHAIALNSGTSALFLALAAYGIGAGDEVIVSPYTMVASVNVVISVGATPVFVDIDPVTYCITPENIQAALTSKTKAVIPVDIFGVPCDATGIKDILPEGVVMIQDTIEALGSTHKGLPVGNVADACAYGFFPNKQITTGIGGMFCTNNTDLFNKVKALSRHGVQTTVSGGDMNSQGYGFNFRMSDITAALGVVQMQRFNEIKTKNMVVRSRLNSVFHTWRIQKADADDWCNDFVYVVQVEGLDKEALITEMSTYNVPVKQYFIGLHTLPHLKSYVDKPLPVATKVAKETVALPYHHDLQDNEITVIYEAFTQALKTQGLLQDE